MAAYVEYVKPGATNAAPANDSKVVPKALKHETGHAADDEAHSSFAYRAFVGTIIAIDEIGPTDPYAPKRIIIDYSQDLPTLRAVARNPRYEPVRAGMVGKSLGKTVVFRIDRATNGFAWATVTDGDVTDRRRVIISADETILERNGVF